MIQQAAEGPSVAGEEEEEEEGRRRQGLAPAGILMAEGARILMVMVGGTVVSSMAVCGGCAKGAGDV